MVEARVGVQTRQENWPMGIAPIRHISAVVLQLSKILGRKSMGSLRGLSNPSAYGMCIPSDDGSKEPKAGNMSAIM